MLGAFLPINIDGDIYIVHLTVKEDNRDHFFGMHRFKEKSPLYQEQNIYLQETQNEVNNSYGENNGKYDETSLTDKQRAIFAVRDRMVRQEPVFERRGLEDNSGNVSGFDGRGSPNGIRTGLVDSVLTISQKNKEILARGGLPPLALYQLKSNDQEAATSFYNAINNAKKALGAKGDSVYTYPVEDYMNMKLLLTEDGLSGIAVKPDGDIVSVFSASTEKHRSVSLIFAAIQNGGKKLDCFDTFLPKIYSYFGFRAVARNNWVDEFAPKGWNKEFYKNFNNGEPDVVYMVYDPAYYGKYSQEDGVIFTGDTAYDNAVALQTKKIKADDKTFYQTEKPKVEISGDELGEYADIKDLRAKAVKYFKKILMNSEPVYRQEIGTIRFSNKGLHEFKHYSGKIDKLKAVVALREVLEKGEYRGFEKNHKERRDSIVGFHKFVSELKIGSKLYESEILVGEDENGNLFYDLFLDYDHSEAINKKLRESTDDQSQSPRSEVEKSTYNQNITDNEVDFNIKLRDINSEKRGAIVFGEDSGAIIRLFQKADASTVIHELAHFFVI